VASSRVFTIGTYPVDRDERDEWVSGLSALEASASTEADNQAASTRRLNVVALGGGHGLATTLRAARRYAAKLTAVVSVADDGGSSGRLREIPGIPAPGDLRRCLVALAEPDSPWARAFEHRFSAGDLAGHALGNLVIAGLAEATGSFMEALEMATKLLGAVGRVLPATAAPVVLKAGTAAGAEVVGQVNVASSGTPISHVCVEPEDAPVPAAVLEELASADQVIMGPGSLFTSVLAVCVIPAIREALRSRKHGRVYVCNLRPQLPETSGFSAEDHLRAVLRHGVPVDVMVAAPPANPADGRLEPASAQVATPAAARSMGTVRVVTAPLALADGSGHDPAKLAEVLSTLAS
jgi:uncharacterized cofD-like protein